MNVDKEKITNFIDKILPFVKNQNNSEGNLKLYLSHELEKFYLNAFAEGQLNVLEQKEVKHGQVRI